MELIYFISGILSVGVIYGVRLLRGVQFSHEQLLERHQSQSNISSIRGADLDHQLDGLKLLIGDIQSKMENDQYKNLSELNKKNKELSGLINKVQSDLKESNKVFNKNVTSWDTSVATRMDDMFLSCSSLSSLNIKIWNTSNVENMQGTFQNLSGITTLDFSNWDYSSVTNMTDFLTGTSITTDDYSALLNRITATSAATGVTLGGGTNTYNAGASASRATLVGNGWTITDGGQV